MAALVVFGASNFAGAETASNSTSETSIVRYETEWNSNQNSQAAYNLGLIYASQGNNNSKAIEWFKKAADAGHAQAGAFYRYLSAQERPQSAPVNKAAKKTVKSLAKPVSVSDKKSAAIASNQYTTQSGDTLYEIAMRYLHGQNRQATRKQTLAIATQIHANNPYAFLQGNQDNLIVGKVLTMADSTTEKPAMDESNQKLALQPTGMLPVVRANIEADLKAKYEILLAELEQKKNAEIAELNQVKETAESKFTLAQSEKAALMEKYLNQGVIIAGLQSQNSNLVAESETAAQDLLALQSENQLYQQTTEQLKQQLVQKGTEIEKAENQLVQYKQSTQKYETRLADLKRSVAQISQLIAGITAENGVDASASSKLVSIESDDDQPDQSEVSPN